MENRSMCTAVAHCLISRATGRGTKLKPAGLLNGHAIHSVAGGPDVPLGGSTTDVVEKRVGQWARALKVVLLILIAERDTCTAVFGRTMGPNMFAEIGQGLVQQVVRAGQELVRSKRVPEKLFPIIEMYVQVNDAAPKYALTMAASPLEPYIQEVQALQAGIRAEAQAILGHLEEIVQQGGEGPGKERQAEGEAGTVLPVCAYIGRFLKRVFRLSPEQQVVLLPEEQLPQGHDPSPEDIKQALGAVVLRTLLVVVRFLESKADQVPLRPLGRIFLMNNINFIVRQVESVPEMAASLGPRWVAAHRSMVEAAMGEYINETWFAMADILEPPGGADPSQLHKNTVKDRFKMFNTAFESASNAARRWVVPDTQLRGLLRNAIVEAVVPVYREWLGGPAVSMLAMGKNPGKYLRFSPDDLEGIIHNEMFEGTNPA